MSCEWHCRSAMVREFGDSQYIEFKPQISPFRWTRPSLRWHLAVGSRAPFFYNDARGAFVSHCYLVLLLSFVLVDCEEYC